MDIITKIYAFSITDLAIQQKGTTDLNGLLTTGINIVSILAGVLAFFYLCWCGFLYITSAGNSDQAKKGGQGVINAIIGIVIIVMAYAIIKAAVSLAGS